MSKTIPELAPESRVLAGRLSRLQPGEEISYKELSDLIGQDVQNGSRNRLNAARRIVERDHHMVLAPVLGKGIKRLDSNDAPVIGESARKTISRKSRRTVKRLIAVVSDASISNDARIAINAELSMLGAIAVCANDRNLKTITDAVKIAGNELAPSKAIEALKSVK